MVVGSIGWGMLMEKEQVYEQANKDVQSEGIFGRAFYPLTLPLTVGPGSIFVAVTLGANATHRYGLHILTIIAALIAVVVVALQFSCATGSPIAWPKDLGKQP